MAISKPAGTWRYEDLLEFPDDGRRWEIIDGELHEMTAPNLAHATVIMNLILTLAPAVTALGGKLYTAPVDVFFRGADPVEPDIMVVFPPKFGSLVRRGIDGPPDLLIEVLSPSNPRHDTVRKRALYARGGIPEYWIVDPDREAIEVLVLDGVEYRLHVQSRGHQSVRSAVLPGLSFAAAVAFAGMPA